jgi:hypothetical protein
MAHPNNGWFEKPTMCSRRMANVNNAKGKFNSHLWEDIAEMNELDLFQMCFFEQFVSKRGEKKSKIQASKNDLSRPPLQGLP